MPPSKYKWGTKFWFEDGRLHATLRLPAWLDLNPIQLEREHFHRVAICHFVFVLPITLTKFDRLRQTRGVSIRVMDEALWRGSKGYSHRSFAKSRFIRLLTAQPITRRECKSKITDRYAPT